ncbi:MAG: hypothetical protein ABFS12_07910 [Bacteroidota bacterium]
MRKTAVLLLLLLVSCNSPTEVTEIQTEPTIHQGVWGFVKFWEGDFMPPAAGSITPVERNVLIYELTSIEEVEKVGYSPFYNSINTDLIASRQSNSKGFFQIELPEGEYSIFILEDSLFYSNSFDGYGNINPFKVEKDSLAKIEFDITYNATF